MNEDEWLACGDPTPMIRHLAERRTTDRKMRLLACAACRLIWDLLPDPRSRQAVEVAERFADGHATAVDLARARGDALAAAGRASRQAAWAAYWAANTRAGGPVWNALAAAAAAPARHDAETASYDHASVWERRQSQEQRRQADLIREVFGDPWQVPRLDPAWLRWGNGVVPAMARAIYDDEAWEQAPILADALEEAGCDDVHLLRHLRGAEHVRGCWAVDLLLQRAE